MNKDSKQNWGVSQESLEFLDRLKEENKQIILILFGNPYSLKLFGKEDAIIVAYEDEIEAVISAFDIIAGRTTAKGKLPITASEQFEEGSGFTFQSKCILFPPLLLPIAVYLYNDEHKHKKIEGNKNV